MQWSNEKEQKHKRLLTMLLNYLCYRSINRTSPNRKGKLTIRTEDSSPLLQVHLLRNEYVEI
jgi:hypothetical protein